MIPIKDLKSVILKNLPIVIKAFELKFLNLSKEEATGICFYNSGAKKWYKNGLLHREDGPAVEYIDGTEIWFLNGKRHRLDGPSFNDCFGCKEWWVDGVFQKWRRD